MLYKVVLTFWVCGWKPKVWPFKWKLLSSTFLWCCLLCYIKDGSSIFWVCGRNPKVWPFKWKLTSSTFLWCCLLCYIKDGSSTFQVCGQNPKVWPFKWKLLSSTFLWCCLLCCTRWFYLWSLWMKSECVTIQMKATEQYFPVVMFIILYKMVLSLESVNEILLRDHSKESY